MTSCAGLADAGGALQIAPLDLSSLAAPGGPAASSLESEATCSEALLGSSAPSPSTVLPLHPSQVRHHATGMPARCVDSAATYIAPSLEPRAGLRSLGEAGCTVDILAGVPQTCQTLRQSLWAQLFCLFPC